MDEREEKKNAHARKRRKLGKDEISEMEKERGRVTKPRSSIGRRNSKRQGVPGDKKRWETVFQTRREAMRREMGYSLTNIWLKHGTRREGKKGSPAEELNTRKRGTSI